MGTGMTMNFRVKEAQDRAKKRAQKKEKPKKRYHVILAPPGRRNWETAVMATSSAEVRRWAKGICPEGTKIMIDGGRR